MDDVKKSFGLKVRSFREAQGISQEKLAEIANIHRTYIGSVERGERNVSLENIYKISDALGIDVRELFEGKE